MNIEEFLNLTVSTPEEAKNLFSLLTGFYFSKDSAYEGLFGFYESLPKEFKEQNQLFAPIFYKIFTRYNLTTEHLNYYNKFNSFWSISEQEEIKQKYKHILQDIIPSEFKNSLEICKALSTYKGKGKNAFEFLKSNNNCIDKIINKNKIKFIENMHKHNCWETLINYNYVDFKEFCSDKGIDHFEIMKTEYIKGYYGIKYLVHASSDQQMLFIMEDISNQANFFDESSFFTPNNQKRNRNEPNVFQVAVMCLSEDMNKTFTYLYKKYPNEINKCMSFYFIDDNNSSTLITDSSYWIKAIDTMVSNTKHTYHKEPINEWEANTIKNKISSAKIIDAIILNESLKEKEAVSFPKRIKI